MRKLFGILCFIAAIVSCRRLSDPSSLLVSASVAPDSLRFGDSVMVTITATNLGSEPITIESNPCPKRFAVIRSDGLAVGPRDETCTGASQPKVLQAGEVYEFVSWWTGEGQFGEDLIPGVYLIRPRYFNAKFVAVAVRVNQRR